jgi:hypothetical protein
VRAVSNSVPIQDPTKIKAQTLRSFGAVAVTGTTCDNLIIDYDKGEFITRLDIAHDTTAIRYFKATTSLGRTLERGRNATTSTSKSLTFTQKQQLGGLWGTSSTTFF